VGEGLKLMRGFGVKWSPDSPGSDAMKTRTESGNPEARKIYPNCLQLFTSDCLGETLEESIATAKTIGRIVTLEEAYKIFTQKQNT